MRHASAESGEGADIDRVLSGEGRGQAAEAGNRLASAGVGPEHVICSTAQRTRETLHHVLARLPAAPVVEWEPGVYGGGPDEVLELVNLVSPDVKTLLVLGHNPTMAQLAAAFAEPPSGMVPFPAAGLAVVDLDVDWLYAAAGTGLMRML